MVAYDRHRLLREECDLQGQKLQAATVGYSRAIEISESHSELFERCHLCHIRIRPFKYERH